MADHHLSDTLVQESEDVMHPTPLEKAQVTPRRKKVHPRSKPEKNGETKFARRSLRLLLSKSSSKKRIRFRPEEVKDVIDLSSNGTGSCDLTSDNSMSATDSKDIRVSSSQNTGSQSSRDGTDCHSSKEMPSESIPTDTLVEEREVVIASESIPLGCSGLSTTY